MGCGLFCLDEEVVFIPSKQVNKTGPSTIILVSIRGRRVITSVNPAPLTLKLSVLLTDNVFPPYLRLALGQWPFESVTDTD